MVGSNYHNNKLDWLCMIFHIVKQLMMKIETTKIVPLSRPLLNLREKKGRVSDLYTFQRNFPSHLMTSIRISER